MKIIFASASLCAALLGGCSPGADPMIDAIKANSDANGITACGDAWEHIDSKIKVRQSDLLKLVETKACSYAHTESETKSACSIPLDFDEIGGRRGKDTYGLKPDTVSALIYAEIYGNELAHKSIMFLIETAHEEIKDTDECLRGMHDLPNDWDDLVEEMGNLRQAGY